MTVEGQLVLCQWVQPPWWLQELAGTGTQAQGSPAASSLSPGETPLGHGTGHRRAQLCRAPSLKIHPSPKSL